MSVSQLNSLSIFGSADICHPQLIKNLSGKILVYFGFSVSSSFIVDTPATLNGHFILKNNAHVLPTEI